MTVVVGDQLQSGTGDWTGGPTSYTYQWQRANDAIGTGVANIGGETRSDHVVVSGDLGKWLRVRVTPANAAGAGTVASSAYVGPVVGVLTGTWGHR